MQTKNLKAIILLSVLILLSLSLFNFKSYETINIQPPSPPIPADEEFLIAGMQSYDDLTNYDLLGFNGSHLYTRAEKNQFPGNLERHTPYGNIGIPNDHLFSTVNTDKTREIITGMYNNYNGSRFLWMRPKIEWLSYGQSSIYKAFQDNPDYWFYSFNNVNGQQYPDWQWNEGKYVLYCSVPVLGQGPVTVLSRLKANTEQSRRQNSTDIEAANWSGDSECDWFVKPKIRIPVSVALNYPETEVCTVFVKMQNGTSDKIIPVIIKAGYFLDETFQYDGKYLEEFNFDYPSWSTPRGIKFTGDLGTLWNNSARGTCSTETYEEWRNHADIKVEWSGNCDMWLDYVKVENDVADRLLKGNDQEFEGWITDEANAINVEPYVYNFYIELFEFNNIPCMGYVNKKIQLATGNKVGLMADLLCYYNSHLSHEERRLLINAEKVKSTFFDRTEFPQVFIGDPYPLTAANPLSCGTHQCEQWSKIPETLPIHTLQQEPKLLGDDVSPANYDAWLQAQLDTFCVWYEGIEFNDEFNCLPIQLRGVFRYLMQNGNAISRECNKPFIAMLPVHQFVMPDQENDREPTVEELSLLTNLSVSYGAKGIVYWWMPSWPPYESNHCEYSYGLVDPPPARLPRYTNVYGQPKWDSVLCIINRLKKWGLTLMSFDNTQTYSYIYRYPNERTECLNTYFNEILTYAPDIVNWEIPASQPEANQYRYVQASTFKNTNENNTQYFMLVNKRCSPYYPIGHPLYPNGENGGRRDLKVKFDANSDAFSGFNNWKIINVENNLPVLTFDKRSGSPIDLGWFMPGEGRLYKLVPVMIDGGTFVCDEEIDNQVFSCFGLVENAGHNLTITGSSTNISFENWSTINFNVGLFQSGDPYDDGPQKITFTSADQWTGFNISNATVKIYGSKFEKLGQNSSEVYALTLTDCGLTDIRNSVFESPYNYDNVGSINSQYLFPDEPQEVNQYFIGNTFTMESYSSEIPVLKLQSYASIAVPVYIQSNTFTCSGSYPSAVYLSNIYNGVVDQNIINGFATGIEVLSSDISLFENNISNSSYTSRCLYGSAASNLFMSQTGDYMLGGNNTFTNSLGENSKNVEVLNSTFNIYNGGNTFDVQASFPIQTWHLYGTFPMVPYTTNAEYNCFKISGIPYTEPQPPNCNVWEGNNLIEFSFFPYSCTGGSQGDNIVINIGNGIYDSVETAPGGGGGSRKISDLRFSISDLKAKSKAESKTETNAKTEAENKTNNPKFKNVNSQFILNPQTLYDSLNILMRFRNYSASRNKAIELITAYPDSIQSVSSLGMLYYSSLVTDTSEAGALNLKTYCENLILNHPGNISLIKRSNYFAQKCKVRLRQYSSAMSGFQQIMNQDPYSYEALLARWDYMATNILDSLSGGSLFGESGDDDRSPFTKEERKQIRENTRIVIEQSNINEERNIEKLKIQTESGDKNAERELKVKQVLKDITKPEHPKSIIEHIKIVNGDIKKISSANKVVNVNKRKNNIPLAYRLAQNYPNPFNPVTTILYELPKNSKVKLVIYDILGREVKILVHNEVKSAGYYKVEFNMQNYASGVYFYRIETDDLKGGKFVDAKKMVLVK